MLVTLNDPSQNHQMLRFDIGALPCEATSVRGIKLLFRVVQCEKALVQEDVQAFTSHAASSQ